MCPLRKPARVSSRLSGKPGKARRLFPAFFYDEELKTEVIGYAVPVYREGQIIGALAATEEADALKETPDQ